MDQVRLEEERRHGRRVGVDGGRLVSRPTARRRRQGRTPAGSPRVHPRPGQALCGVACWGLSDLCQWKPRSACQQPAAAQARWPPLCSWRSLNQHARWACRYGDAEADKGIKTTPDARFFAISSALDEAFTNKDVPLVLQARAGWPRGVWWGVAAPEGSLVRSAPACLHSALAHL